MSILLLVFFFLEHSMKLRINVISKATNFLEQTEKRVLKWMFWNVLPNLKSSFEFKTKRLEKCPTIAELSLVCTNWNNIQGHLFCSSEILQKPRIWNRPAKSNNIIWKFLKNPCKNVCRNSERSSRRNPNKNCWRNSERNHLINPHEQKESLKKSMEKIRRNFEKSLLWFLQRFLLECPLGLHPVIITEISLENSTRMTTGIIAENYQVF